MRPEFLQDTEQEPRVSDLKLKKSSWGTTGVFLEYPDQLLEALSESARKFEHRWEKGEHGRREKFPLDVDLGDGNTYQLYVKATHSQDTYRDRKVSILKEIIMNRIAAFRYKKQFGEALSIERPVGFFVENSPFKRKYAIFERIGNITPKPEGDESFTFKIWIQNRLKQVGIMAVDYDIVWSEDKSVPGGRKRVICDTEAWYEDK